MEKGTFSDDTVVALHEKSFVGTAIDTDSNEALADRYGVEGIPLTVILAPEGDVLASFVGDPGAAAYKAKLQAALDAYGKIRALQKRIAETPNDPAPVLDLAEVFHAIGNPPRAIEAYSKAGALLEAKSEKSEAERRRLADILVKLGRAQVQMEVRPEDLSATVGRIEKADPDGKLGTAAPAAYFRALVEFGEGRPDAAYERFGEVLSKHPDAAEAEDAALWYGWLALDHKKDKAKAREVFEAFLAKYPGSQHRDSVRQMLEAAGGGK